MKKIFLLSMFIAAVATARGEVATAVGDTVVTAKDVGRVLLTEKGDSLNVSLFGKGKDKNYSFRYTRTTGEGATEAMEERGARWDFTAPFTKKEKRGKREVTMGGIGVGFVTALGAPDGMDLNRRSSIEIFADVVSINLLSNNEKHAFSMGVGIDWRNYRLGKEFRFLYDAAGNIVTGPYPEGVSVDYSRIKQFSWTVPFRYTYYFTKKISAALAVIINWNTYASMETRYKENGVKVRDFDKHIHQQPVSVDFMAHVSFDWFGVYVKGSPCRVFNPGFGPDFRTLSAGILIGF